MRRGDICLVAAPGDYGKPRPAVVVQSDLLNPTHAGIVVCLMTSATVDAPGFRIAVEPSPSTGLRVRSQIMADKITTLRRERIGRRIGTIDDGARLQLDRALAVVLGLAG